MQHNTKTNEATECWDTGADKKQQWDNLIKIHATIAYTIVTVLSLVIPTAEGLLIEKAVGTLARLYQLRKIEPLNKVIKAENAAAKGGQGLVKIATIEDDVMIFSSKIGDETVEGMAKFIVKDEKLILNQLHLVGSSAGKVGRDSLWNIAKSLVKKFKVKEVIIQGGKRTTGKYKGKIPTEITIRVD